MKQPLTQNSDVKVQPGCTKKRTGVIIEVLLLWNLLISFGFSYYGLHCMDTERLVKVQNSDTSPWKILRKMEMDESQYVKCNWNACTDGMI